MGLALLEALTIGSVFTLGFSGVLSDFYELDRFYLKGLALGATLGEIFFAEPSNEVLDVFLAVVFLSGLVEEALA